MIYDKDLIVENSTENILNTTYYLADELIKENDTVLDIGCATGYFGEYLTKVKKCNVIGIDFLEEYVEKSRQRNVYNDLITLNLDEFTDELVKYEKHFDKIVLLDVLEHLRNPEKTLKKISNYLKDDGQILISIPNISHQSIKLSLLADEFDYQEIGLLDRTHISFFTLNSFVRLLNHINVKIENFKIVKDDRIYANSEINLKKIPRSVKVFVRNTLCAKHYQYFFAVSKTDLTSDEIQKNNQELINKTLKKDKDSKIISNSILRLIIKILCAIIPLKILRNQLKNLI